METGRSAQRRTDPQPRAAGRRGLLRLVLGTLAAGAWALSGCGMKGPLYLPRPGSDDDAPRQNR
jgi:predicted small lipoprotein YifL